VFTGLIEDVATIVTAQRRSDAVVFTVRPTTISILELRIGESVSHDGVCLTVTQAKGETFCVLAGAETLSKTTLGSLRAGSRVNLERALRMGDRLGGHWVSGHIDGTGELASKRDAGANIVLDVRCSPELLRYIVRKGSIAMCGISLTVNTVDAAGFSVAIIPHTWTNTSLGQLRPGSLVNLEVDLIAKHVEKLLAAQLPNTQGSYQSPSLVTEQS
jgi:riboflavin synthase